MTLGEHIPTFPNFKRPDISDKVLFDTAATQIGVFSDFNFYSFFTWDTKATNAFSQLYGNLIVSFSSYTSDNVFLSIIGTNRLEDTVSEIFRHNQDTKQSKILHLVPEPTAALLKDSKKYTVEEDLHNHDYVYCLKKLSDLKGKQYKNKRRLANKFSQLNDTIIKEVDITDLKTQVEIFELLTEWNQSKLLNGKKPDLNLEQLAILRMAKYSQNKSSLLTHCTYYGGKIVGFSVDELLPHNFVLSHYFKTSLNAPKGVAEFFNQKLAALFLNKGYRLWNWEQDLGLQSLQTSKLSYRPVHYQKKFTVSEIS